MKYTYDPDLHIHLFNMKHSQSTELQRLFSMSIRSSVPTTDLNWNTRPSLNFYSYTWVFIELHMYQSIYLSISSYISKTHTFIECKYIKDNIGAVSLSSSLRPSLFFDYPLCNFFLVFLFFRITLLFEFGLVYLMM